MEFLAGLGQLVMLLGFLAGITAQIAGFVHVVRNNVLHGIIALIIPGALLYFVWFSQYKMPVLLRLWFGGILLFALGAVLTGIGADLG